MYILQQVSLLYTDVANSAFFTIFYVPMVPIISFFNLFGNLYIGVYGHLYYFAYLEVYLLSDFSDATIRFGDALVI